MPTTADYQRPQSCAATRPALQPAAAVPAHGLSSLEGLPWLTQSFSEQGALRDDRSPSRRGEMTWLHHAAIAAVVGFLCGGALYVSDGTAPQPAPLVQQHGIPPASNSSARPAVTGARAADAPIVISEVAAEGGTPEDARPPRIERQDRSASLPRVEGTKPTAAPSATPPVAVGQPLAMAGASAPVPAAAPAADSPASPTTLKDFRSTMEDCRDAIREVIRLGRLQRPGDTASAEELARYRLRQQNAEAARTYRTYLETLSRSARGAKSETLTRQSLERARQTLGYLETMLSDSKASLR